MALMIDDLAAGAETSARFLTRAPRSPTEMNLARTSLSWAAFPTTLDPLPKMLGSFKVVRMVKRAPTPPHSNNWKMNKYEIYYTAFKL